MSRNVSKFLLEIKSEVKQIENYRRAEGLHPGVIKNLRRALTSLKNANACATPKKKFLNPLNGGDDDFN